MLYKEYSHKKKKFKNKKLQNEVICYGKNVETFPLKVYKEKKTEDDDEDRLLQLYHADCTLDVLVEHSFPKSNPWEFPIKCKSKENLDVTYKSSKIDIREEVSQSDDEQLILSTKKSKRRVKVLKKKRKTVEVLSTEEIAEFYRHLVVERKCRLEKIIEKYENNNDLEIVDLENSKIYTATGRWRRLREKDLNPSPYVYNEKSIAYLKMIWERSCLLEKDKTTITISFAKETRKYSNFLYNSNETNEPFLSKDFTPEKYSNSHFKNKAWLKNPSQFDNSLYEHSPHLSTSSSGIEFDETIPCHFVRTSHISSPQHFNLKTIDLNEEKYPQVLKNQSFDKKNTLSTQRCSSKEVQNWSEDDLSKSSQQSLSPPSVRTFRSKSGRQVSLLHHSSSSGRSVKDKIGIQYDSDESSFLEDPNNSSGKESVSNKTPAKSKKSKNELAYQISKDICHDSVVTVTTKKFDKFTDFKVQKNSYKLSKSPQQPLPPCSGQTFRTKSGRPVSLWSFSSSSGKSFKDKIGSQYDSDESSFLEDPNNSSGKESVSNKTPVKSRKSKNELAYQISKDICHDSVATVTTKKFDNFTDFKVQKNSYKLSKSPQQPLPPCSGQTFRTKSGRQVSLWSLSASSGRSFNDKIGPQYDSDESSFLEDPNNSSGNESVSNKTPAKSRKSKNELAYQISKDICHDSVATVTTKKFDNFTDFKMQKNSYKLSKSPQQPLPPCSGQTFRTKSGRQVSLWSLSSSSGRSFKDKIGPQYDSDESSFLEDPKNSSGKESVSNKTPAKSRKSKNELSYQISKDICHDSVVTVTTKKFDNFADFKVQKNSYKISKNRTDSKNKISISNEDVKNNPLDVPRANRKVRNMPPSLELSCLKNDSKDKNHTKKNILEKETLSERNSSKRKFETFMPYSNLEYKSRSLQSVRSKICKSTDDSIETKDVSDNLSKERKVSASEKNVLKPSKASSKFKKCYVTLERLPVKDDVIKYNYENVCNVSNKPLISSKCESLAAKDLKRFNEYFQTTENHLTDNSPNSLTSFIALNSSSKNSCSLKHPSPKNKTCKTDDSNERQNKKRKIGSTEFAVVRKSKRIANKATLQQPVDQRNDSKAKKLLGKDHFKHTGLSQELILSEQRPFSKDSKDVKSVDSPSDKHLETPTSCPNNYDNLKNKVIAKYSKIYNLKDLSVRLDKVVGGQISNTEDFEHALAHTTMLPKEFGSFTDKYKASQDVQKCLDTRYRLRNNSIKTPPFLSSTPKNISSMRKNSKKIKSFLQDNKMEFKYEENSAELSSSWSTGQNILTKKQINKKDKIEDFHQKKIIASDFSVASGHLEIDVLSSPGFNKLNYRF